MLLAKSKPKALILSYILKVKSIVVYTSYIIYLIAYECGSIQPNKFR